MECLAIQSLRCNFNLVCMSAIKVRYMYMFCVNRGSGQSMDCLAQTVDWDNPWIVLRKPWISLFLSAVCSSKCQDGIAASEAACKSLE